MKKFIYLIALVLLSVFPISVLIEQANKKMTDENKNN